MKKKNRVVVITGATSGIGLETANLYRQNGDIVCSLSLTNPNNVENFYYCNVANDELVKQVMDEIGQKYGHIDILINNAGYGVSGVTELISSERAHAIFDVNTFGVLSCTNHALKYMPKGSKVINISSTCALFPVPFRTLYCASKAATSMITYSQRLECRDFGVEIGCVCPGDTKTNFTKNREKHFDTVDRYGDRPIVAAERIDSKNDKRMSPSIIAKKLFKMGSKKHLKAMTIISAKYKLLYFVNRFLPMSVLLHFDEKLMGGFTKGDKYRK